MKINKKLLSVLLFVITFVGATSYLNVSAQDNPISNEQINRIYTNCTLTKNTLNQIHASDALLRVNMGQIYESMSNKLMTRFNNRVANNNFDNKSLKSVTDSYNSTLDTFRTDYKRYEEHLTAAINIDCKKQPVSFYDAISSARSDRGRVHNDIVKINQFIDQYQLAVGEFEKNYIDIAGGAKN